MAFKKLNFPVIYQGQETETGKQQAAGRLAFPQLYKPAPISTAPSIGMGDLRAAEEITKAPLPSVNVKLAVTQVPPKIGMGDLRSAEAQPEKTIQPQPLWKSILKGIAGNIIGGPAGVALSTGVKTPLPEPKPEVSKLPTVPPEDINLKPGDPGWEKYYVKTGERWDPFTKRMNPVYGYANTPLGAAKYRIDHRIGAPATEIGRILQAGSERAADIFTGGARPEGAYTEPKTGLGKILAGGLGITGYISPYGIESGAKGLFGIASEAVRPAEQFAENLTARVLKAVSEKGVKVAPKVVEKAPEIIGAATRGAGMFGGAGVVQHGTKAMEGKEAPAEAVKNVAKEAAFGAVVGPVSKAMAPVTEAAIPGKGAVAGALRGAAREAAAFTTGQAITELPGTLLGYETWQDYLQGLYQSAVMGGIFGAIGGQEKKVAGKQKAERRKPYEYQEPTKADLQDYEKFLNERIGNVNAEWKARKQAYRDAVEKFGPDSPEAQKAKNGFEEWTVNLFKASNEYNAYMAEKRRAAEPFKALPVQAGQQAPTEKLQARQAALPIEALSTPPREAVEGVSEGVKELGKGITPEAPISPPEIASEAVPDANATPNQILDFWKPYFDEAVKTKYYRQGELEPYVLLEEIQKEHHEYTKEDFYRDLRKVKDDKTISYAAGENHLGKRMGYSTPRFSTDRATIWYMPESRTKLPSFSKFAAERGYSAEKIIAATFNRDDPVYREWEALYEARKPERVTAPPRDAAGKPEEGARASSTQVLDFWRPYYNKIAWLAYGEEAGQEGGRPVSLRTLLSEIQKDYPGYTLKDFKRDLATAGQGYHPADSQGNIAEYGFARDQRRSIVWKDRNGAERRSASLVMHPPSETAPKASAVTGNTAKAKTERGTTVDTRYAVVSAGDLISSHDTALRIDERFPKELQPRDRSRLASEDQVNRIVNNLEPEFLGESPKASEGAPIIGKDNVVESGNARVIALKRVYEQNNPSGEKYRQWLIDNAEKFGLDPKAVDGVDKPVLVRVRESDVDRKQFVQEANEQAVAAMSATEQARVDSEKLSSDLLGQFKLSESGDIYHTGNMNFIRDFFREVVPPNEIGRYIDAKGNVSQEGLTRIRNAIFAKAYGDIGSIERLAESADNNIKNITNAMLAVAPDIARVKEGARAGVLYDLDISSEIADAANTLAELRSTNRSVTDYLRQQTMFEEGISPLAKDILDIFDKNKRSAKAISAILKTYTRLAEASGDPRQQRMFDSFKYTKSELLDAAIERMKGEYEESALFPDKTPGRKAAGENVGENGQRAARGTARAEAGAKSQEVAAEPTDILANLKQKAKLYDNAKDFLSSLPKNRALFIKNVKAAGYKDLVDFWAKTKYNLSEVALVQIMKEKGVSKPEQEMILKNIARFYAAADKTGLNVDLSIKLSNIITDQLTDALLKQHGFKPGTDAYIAGKTSINKDGKLLSAAIELLCNSGKPVSQEVMHEFAEIWATIWKTANPGDYQKAVDYLVGKGLERERAKEHLPEIIADYAMSGIADLKEGEAGPIPKGFFERLAAMFKEWVASVLKRLKYFKERVLPNLSPEVRSQAEAFSRGDWETAFRSIMEKRITPETRYSVKQGYAPAFYSQLERSIKEKMPNRANAAQIMSIVRSGGVKADELKWVGLEDWLKKQEGPVNKQDVLQFIRDNDLKIIEVTKRTPNAPVALNEEEWKSYLDKDFVEDYPIMYEQMKEDFVDEEGNLVISTYGDDYRYDLWGKYGNLFKSKFEKVIFPEEEVPLEEQAKYKEHTLPGGENYREILFILPSAEKLFRSSHWNEPNVLAHTRLTDRDDNDGNRILFIEEIQSDWHQKGREKGYVGDIENRLAKAGIKPVFDIGFSHFENEKGDILGDPDIFTVSTVKPTEEQSRLMQEYRDKIIRGEAAPDAPLSKTWHEFVLKRLLRYAAENGYDKIGWTTGDQQNERYDLSKKVSEIAYWRENDQKIGITVLDNNGNVIPGMENVSYDLKELVDILGKEIAEKIVNDEGTDTPETSEFYDKRTGKLEAGVKVLQGEDLKVGGHGMRGFYDKIIPDFLKSYGKKWGARVEDAKIPSLKTDENGTYDIYEGIHSLPITDAMKRSVLYEGQRKFSVKSDIFDAILDTYKKWAGPKGSMPGSTKTADISELAMKNLKSAGVSIEDLDNYTFEQAVENVKNLAVKKDELRSQAFGLMHEDDKKDEYKEIRAQQKAVEAEYNKAAAILNALADSPEKAKIAMKALGLRFTVTDIVKEMGQEVNKAIDEVAPPAGFSIKITRKSTEEVRKESRFRFSDENIEARWNAAQGLKPEAISVRLKELWQRFINVATREFEHLPRTAEFAELRESLRQLSHQKGVQDDKTLRLQQGLVVNMTPEEYDLFTRKVILDDLAQESEAGHDLPFGFTPETLEHERSRINSQVESNTTIKKAVENRKRIWTAVKNDYIKAMKAVGFNVEDRLKRQDYYRHQILEYARNKGISGAGRKLETPTKRGFLKQRGGSERDINTDYVQAEYEVMAQMLFDTEVAKVIAKVDKYYNIRKTLEEKAKEANERAIDRVIEKELRDIYESPTAEQLYKFMQKMAMAFAKLKKLAKAGDLWDGENHEFADVVKKLEEQVIDEIQDADETSRLFRYLAELAKQADDVPGVISARTVFKAIVDRRAFIKETLGDKYMTWRRMVPDGYTVWQPREGTHFYLANSIPEHIADQLLTGAFEEIGLGKDDIQKVLARGQRFREYVIKDEVALTLDNLKPTLLDNVVTRAARWITRLWKQYVLTAPMKFLKYNVRNLSGDAEAVFVGNPHAFKYVPRAIHELYQVFAGDRAMTPVMRKWFERGGMQTVLQVAELGDINKLKMFEHLYETRGTAKEIPTKIWQKYWQMARMGTDFREAILRYAAFLDYLEQLEKNNGVPKNFGASLRDEVMALHDNADKAAKLSNELLGAYDSVTVLGQNLREFLIPFWSWNEVNFVRYTRFFRNAMQDGKLTGTIGRKFAGIGLRSPFIAYNVGKFALKALGVSVALYLYNNAFFAREEKDLPADVQAKPHIIIGRDKNGKVRYIDRLGMMSDFLEWFGLDEFRKDAQDYLNGYRPLKEIATDMARSPFNKFVQGVNPLIKMPAELLTKTSLYPDAFKGSHIYDTWEYLARQFGLSDEYKFLAGKPRKGYSDTLQNWLILQSEPGEAAYYDVRDLKQHYMKEVLKKGSGAGANDNDKSEALYNVKLAVRYQDMQAFEKYLMAYALAGGTEKGLNQSLNSLHPLYGLKGWNGNVKQGDTNEALQFYESLAPEDQEKVRTAVKFYENVLRRRGDKEIKTHYTQVVEKINQEFEKRNSD